MAVKNRIIHTADNWRLVAVILSYVLDLLMKAGFIF